MSILEDIEEIREKICELQHKELSLSYKNKDMEAKIEELLKRNSLLEKFILDQYKFSNKMENDLHKLKIVIGSSAIVGGFITVLYLMYK